MTDKTTEHIELHVAGGLLLDETAIVEGGLMSGASNPVAWRRYAGGVAANAARAACSVYKSQNYLPESGPDSCSSTALVTLHTALGDDSDAAALLSTMASIDLLVESHYVDGFSTGRYSAIMDSGGNLLLGLADVSVAEQLQASHVLEKLNQSAQNSLANTLPGTPPYTLLIDANLSADCINGLTKEASDDHSFIAALAVSPHKAKRLLPVAKQVDLLFCNRREAIALASATAGYPHHTEKAMSLEQLTSYLVELGFSDLIITDAGDGLLSRCQGVNTTMQVPDVSITHNVNGAGDTLAGATLAAMTTGLDQLRAIELVGLPLAADVLTGKRSPLKM